MKHLNPGLTQQANTHPKGDIIVTQCKAGELATSINLDINASDESSRTLASVLGVGKSSINAHRANACACYTAADEPATVTTGRETVDYGPEGGEFNGITSDKPLTSWDHVFEKFNLDPNEFAIDGDSVRCSMWNQSSKEGGDRDVVTLYSYRAKFKRRQAKDEANLADLINHVRNVQPAKREAVTGDPVTVVVSLADWQLGKSENDGKHGTLQTIERLKSALAGVQEYIEHRRAEGHNIERILLANMGDHIESTHGSYASQAGTVDLNLRDQLTLALELNMQWIKAMNDYAPVTYTATLCNHGTFSRVGHDSVTGDSDNATGFIGDQLKTVCKLIPGLDVDFNIPRDEMITTTNVSGVNVAMAHGHKISGSEETWLARQSQALTHRERFIPDLWLVAHKHHSYTRDLGPYSVIQSTTVDPGSKWLYDAKGVYSTPGVTVFIAGEHLPMKYDNHRVIV